jgi:alpha-mannosidase
VLHARFNENGEMTSLIDKETGNEMLAGYGNQLCLYQDVPSQFDAWDIDRMSEDLPLLLEEPGTLDVIQLERYQAAIKLERKIHNSTLKQEIRLQQGSHRIDFETTIDWQESHKLLKVSFPVNIHTDEALHEIQFGYIKRPNHRSRPYDADRFEVCNHKWSALLEENHGVAILNDSKYGISVVDNDMQLTLLKSALAPAPRADKGVHNFTYSLYYWNGSFYSNRLVQEAYELNCPVLIIPGSAGDASIFQIDADNIILETVKLAEDNSGDIIVRLYESKRNLTNCVLSTSLPVKNVYHTDLLERNQAELPIQKGKIRLDFHPFEIKTLRLMME